MKTVLGISVLATLLFVGCHRAPDVVPAAAQYYYNGTGQAPSAARHDPLAAYLVQTPAATLDITAKTTYVDPFTVGASITASVDGRADTTFALLASADEQHFLLRLPGSGPHEVELVEGAQIRPNEQGPVLFTSITGVSVPRGQALTVVPLRRTTEGIVVFGDSRTVGGAGTRTSRDAWPVQLRHLRRADVYVTGYASLQLGAHLGTAARQDSLTHEISQRLAPYTVKTLWLEAGVNDYLSATYSPDQLTAYYRQWLPKVRAAIPGVRVYLQTDLWKRGEQANKLGFSLPQYRVGEEAGASADAVVVDGRALADSTTLQDGVHQTAAGDAGIARKVNAVLGPR
ncbi:SGNH/GDSL hydrolase family protein [Hymenobacter nivis]|uniref:SGNH/GDSL hydrolase family protein n=1 Tax=Hymenobacter nivis TaxID=1850093 RepID=A0A502HBH5_9BACT|nr:SGNH/GDSL hydrolase family protein [Hymenobacter nivis]TPG71997.1 SGNH/GDSL hydrolase family protein [Hymenobacter nivis]